MNAIETLRQQLNTTAPHIEVGTTVRYIKRFTGNRTYYTYSAIFTGEQWFTTSKSDQSPGVLSHADFIKMLQGKHIVKVQLATEFEDIIDNTDRPTTAHRSSRTRTPNASTQGRFGAGVSDNDLIDLVESHNGFTTDELLNA